MDVRTESVKKFIPAISALILITLLASLAFWTGITPWVLYLELIILMTVALATWMRTILALSLSLFGSLSLYAVLLPLFVNIPGVFSAKIYIVVLLLIITSSFVALKNVYRICSAHYLKIFISNKALFFSTVVLFFAFIIQCLVSPNFSFWAMNNDAVWNSISARFLISDGGLLGNLHPNASPLTAAILAAATSPGRELIPPSSLLSHDISLQAQAWFAVIILTSFFAGIIASLGLQKAQVFTKWIGILSAMLLPISWYYSGFAVRFGFYNASLAILALLSIWAVWQIHFSMPAVSVLILCLGAIVLLATWAPLVLVPGLILLYMFFVNWKIIWKQKGSLWISLIGLIFLGGYAVFITMKDLLVQGGALSVDGGIFDFQPTQFALILSSAVLVSLFVSNWFTKDLTFVGVVLVTAAAVVGVAFLAYQRRESESMWGYYPVKFGWLISTLLLEIILIGLLRLIPRFTFSATKRALFVTVSGGFVILLMSLSGVVSPKNIITPIGLLTVPTAERQNEFVQKLSELAVVGQKNLVVSYGDTKAEDLAFNNWLLQINAESSEEPIRWYSYYLDGSDLNMVCEAAQIWGDGVVIHTTNTDLSSSLKQACPNISARVSVHG